MALCEEKRGRTQFLWSMRRKQVTRQLSVSARIVGSIFFCSLDPEQLFDLDKDPNELDNLIEKTDYKSITESFRDTMEATWNLDRFDQDVRESQAKRKVVYEALRKGGYYPWDFQPLKQASERYMRNHMDLNILEASQRYPSDD